MPWDVVLLGVTLAVLLVVGLLALAGMPMIEKASHAAQSAVGETGARLERVLGAFRTVKAAGAEAREIAAIERCRERVAHRLWTVTHRLWTVTQADRIVVLDNGTVRATGTHDELVQRDPLYAEFAATQLLTGEHAG